VARVNVDPFADVAGIDWTSLEHAYGNARDVPEMMRNLASENPAERDLGMDGLWDAVHHQGDVYDSTVAVIPFLIRAAQTQGFPSRVGVLEVLASIAETWEPASTPRDDDHAAWLDRCAQAHDILAAAVESFLPLLSDANSDVRRAVAELLAYFPDERALIFPAVRDALARSGAAAGLEAPDPQELSALIDAGTGYGSRDEATGAAADEWLVSLWQSSTDPADQLAVISRIAARGRAAFPGDLVQTVTSLVDEVYAVSPAAVSVTEPPSLPPVRPSLVAAMRVMNQEVNAGQTAPWVGTLLDDIHRALEARVAERTALAMHELRAPQWERRYHGVRAANWVISRYRGDHSEFVRLVGEQLAHPEQRVHRMAESVLRDTGDVAAPALESLAARVAQGPEGWSNRSDMSSSIYALARLRDPRALPALRWHANAWRPPKPKSFLGLSTKPETASRLPSSFGGALVALGPIAGEFLPLLTAVLKVPGPERGYDDRTTYIAALGALGPLAAPAVPSLLTTLNEPKLAEAAAKALDKIAPDAPEVRKAFTGIVERQAPGCVTAALALARLHPSTELAGLLVSHLDGKGRLGLEAAVGLDLFAGDQIHLTPEVQRLAKQGEDRWSWDRLAAAIAVHAAEGDVATATAAFAWAWDTNLSIRAEVARYLPRLGEAGLSEFEGRLDAELADPTRHRFRQFPTGASTSDVVDDEELLRLCELARRPA